MKTNPNMPYRLRSAFRIMVCTGLFLVGIVLNIGAQTRIRDFIDAEIFLKGVFGQDCRMDEYGILKINGKDYKAGNVTFRLRDVRIRYEEPKAGPNCPVPCPPKAVIKFVCRKTPCVSVIQSENSIEFPASMAVYQLEFTDLPKGRKMFSIFLELQRFLRQIAISESSFAK
ncbi:MAG: hypothetical protein FJ343_01650 [Sphingomonadales bacterium]|nr:hypothetical protein [Sphingomonadales bacterium]